MVLLQFDLLIRGGTVVDGSGAAPVAADLAVHGTEIAAVGDLSAADAATVIDASGLTVAPGFIDCHSHSELTLLADPRAQSKIQQGITTELNGQCGLTPYPVREEHRAELAATMAFISAPVEWDWLSPADYMDRLDAARPPYSAATMVGHSALRAWAMGFEDRPPTAAELAAMCAALRECFDQGCLGLSFGMVYAPGYFAQPPEIEALCRVAAERDRLVSVHLRSEGAELIEAITEFCEMGLRAAEGLRLQIDHLKCAGERWWGKMDEALTTIERHRATGLDVAFDVYPYTAGSRHLGPSLPAWVHAEGATKMLAILADEAARERLRQELAAWEAGEPDAPEFDLSFDKTMVASVETEANQPLVGKTLQQIADERRLPALDAALDLLVAEDGFVNVVIFSMCEQDMQKALAHPLGCVATDGLAFAPDGPLSSGCPHPRSYGTYPRLLGKCVREEGVLGLEEAVRKITSLPASRLGLTDRGLIAPGKRADLVIFDPERIIDTATYAEPHQFPVGIERVIVAGQVAVHSTEQSAERHGGALRA